MKRTLLGIGLSSLLAITTYAHADDSVPMQQPMSAGSPQAGGTAMQPGSRRYDGRPREAPGRRSTPREPRGWGALQGGLGVCIIVASAALGTVATIVTRREPGLLLGHAAVLHHLAALPELGLGLIRRHLAGCHVVLEGLS